MKRPGRPAGRTVKQVSVALRPGDQELLARLALELVLQEQGNPDTVAGRLRPSVSFALRHLIDAERRRRAERAAKKWKVEHPRKPVPEIDELLQSDYVFGAPDGSASA